MVNTGHRLTQVWGIHQASAFCTFKAFICISINVKRLPRSPWTQALEEWTNWTAPVLLLHLLPDRCRLVTDLQPETQGVTPSPREREVYLRLNSSMRAGRGRHNFLWGHVHWCFEFWRWKHAAVRRIKTYNRSITWLKRFILLLLLWFWQFITAS